jgi:hypothetical protein
MKKCVSVMTSVTTLAPASTRATPVISADRRPRASARGSRRRRARPAAPRDQAEAVQEVHQRPRRPAGQREPIRRGELDHLAFGVVRGQLWTEQMASRDPPDAVWVEPS